MRRMLIAAGVMALGSLAQAQGIEQFLKIRTPGAATIAPDGTLYVRDWPQGIFQLFRAEEGVARPGGPTRQLTHFPDGLSGYSLSPDGTKILLLHAVGGNENSAGLSTPPTTPAPAISISTALTSRATPSAATRARARCCWASPARGALRT